MINVKSNTMVAKKGHFVVYSADKSRFMVPLACLTNCVFMELLKISEEEFGLSTDGPITLPCDAVFLKSIISLVRSGAPKNVESSLLSSVTAGRCSLSDSLQLGYSKQHLHLTGF